MQGLMPGWRWRLVGLTLCLATLLLAVCDGAVKSELVSPRGVKCARSSFLSSGAQTRVSLLPMQLRGGGASKGGSKGKHESSEEFESDRFGRESANFAHSIALLRS